MRVLVVAMAGIGNIVNLKPNKKGGRLGGRKAGTPNKNTRILKDALLDAASAIGFPEEITLLDDVQHDLALLRRKSHPASATSN
jgi:hypothetical protein